MSVPGSAVVPPRVTTFGRYELITPIGRGGMAEVHLAIQRGPAGFEKLVVVKVIHEHMAREPAFVEMMLDEARLAALVKHPNVVDIYDLGEANGRNYVAMEYLEGEPLLAVLRAGSEGRRLDPLSTARLIADTAEGLDAAHRLKSRDGRPLGLVHHDVSLGNIVVLYSGQVKLVDFGVAKAQQAGKGEKVQGKFAYMAPEKLEEGGGDRRCDIWSLGVVAYEALTLTRLFKGGTNIQETVHQVMTMPIVPPSQVNGDVHADFDPIILKALERDPAKRYQTAKAFGDDLEEVLREHKYGGKNDKIASYMQGTFEKTIAAREQLLSQVLGEGKASAAVVEAAFPETVVAVEQTITTTGAAGQIETSTVTVSEGIPRRADPSWATGPQAVSIQQLQKWVERRRNRRPIPAWLPYVGGAVLLLLILVVATKGDPEEPEAEAAAAIEPPPLTPSPPSAAIPAALPVDAGTAIVDDAPAAGSALPDEPIDIEMGGSTVRKPRPHGTGTSRPKLKGDAPSLYAQALQMLRNNDAKGALAALEQARQVDPSYAPIWYGLGLVYEDLGKRGQARAAFLRYLSISPRAANADQVRARIERL